MLKDGLVDTTTTKYFQYKEKVRNVYWDLDRIWKHLLPALLSCPSEFSDFSQKIYSQECSIL